MVVTEQIAELQECVLVYRVSSKDLPQIVGAVSNDYYLLSRLADSDIYRWCTCFISSFLLFVTPAPLDTLHLCGITCVILFPGLWMVYSLSLFRVHLSIEPRAALSVDSTTHHCCIHPGTLSASRCLKSRNSSRGFLSFLSSVFSFCLKENNLLFTFLQFLSQTTHPMTFVSY